MLNKPASFSFTLFGVLREHRTSDDDGVLDIQWEELNGSGPRSDR